MDSVFWTGLIAGAILSLIASIVANLLNNKIRRILDARQAKFKLKRRSKEENTFAIVSGLKKGIFNQTYYFARKRSQETSGLIFMSIFLIAAFVLYSSYGVQDKLWPDMQLSAMTWSDVLHTGMIYALLFLAIYSTWDASNASSRMNEVGSKLNSYDKYRADLLRKYPDFDFGDSA